MLINIFENLIFLHKLNKGTSTRRIVHCQEQLEIYTEFSHSIQSLAAYI